MTALKMTGCPNLATDGYDLYTRSLVPGRTIYGEKTVKFEEQEFRRWDPRRSKMAAYTLLTGGCGGIAVGDVVIYLGASTGTTLSHISDIVADGEIYAVEISKRSFRNLMDNCSDRTNIITILGDARDSKILDGMVSGADYLYVDIAQRDQVQIFVDYIERFGCREGMLMLKCRSIDVVEKPLSVAIKARRYIEERDLTVTSMTDLGRYEKDHYAFHVKGRGR